MLRRLIEVALEWNTHVWIVDGDIKKADDIASHNTILEALLEANCPRVLAAAFTRELSGSGNAFGRNDY